MPARPITVDHDFQGTGIVTGMRAATADSDAVSKLYVDSNFQRTLYVGNVAPADPDVGDIWLDTTTL